MHCYSLRFRKSPHFKNYGSFAAFVVSMFDVILVHLSVCRHKGTRSIWRWQLNVFSIEQSHFLLLRSGSIATRREKLKFKLSSQLNWSPHQKGIQNSQCLPGSGFNAVDSVFKVLDSSLRQWNLESGIQSLVGFRISWAVFRIPSA